MTSTSPCGRTRRTWSTATPTTTRTSRSPTRPVGWSSPARREPGTPELTPPPEHVDSRGNLPTVMPDAVSEPPWEQRSGDIADTIVRGLAPRRVFDAGCGRGVLVGALWDRGVEAHGQIGR